MNNQHGKARLEDFLERLPDNPHRLLMLDYDGTLAPFQEDRESAGLYPGVREHLKDILQGTNTRTVIISGRGAYNVRRLLGIDPNPEIWGSHGCERLYPDGHYELEVKNKADLEYLAKAKEWIAEQKDSEQYEIKPLGVALHWRGLSLEKMKQLKYNTVRKWKQYTEQSNLEFAEFDGGIELKSVGFTKGDAVKILIEELQRHLAAAYLGDDLTDEDAFKEIRGRGLGILVRKEWRPTAAEVHLIPPGQLIEFLKKWYLKTK